MRQSAVFPVRIPLALDLMKKTPPDASGWRMRKSL